MENRLSYKALSYETWADFEKLFAKHKGVRGGCWCTHYLCFSCEYEKMEKDERRKYHRNLCEEKKAEGVLVYYQDTPVGWCQFGRPDIVKRYNRGRDYSKLEISDEDKPDWRISCIFTDKNHRKMGIGRFAVESALKYISESGGGVIEVFPFDLSYRGITKIQHNGSVSLYNSLGFSEISRLGKNTVLMRKRV